MQRYEDETKCVGRELGEMYAYAIEYGFHGGLVLAKSLILKRQPLIIKEYVKGADVFQFYYREFPVIYYYKLVSIS